MSANRIVKGRCSVGGSLPAPERAQRIVDLARQGHDAATITTKVITNRKHAFYVRKTVDRVMADVDAYDTHIDDVAVTRAYQGDKAVWDALTHYETVACIDLLMGRALVGKTHVTFPHVPAVDIGPEFGWLGLWAQLVGEDPRLMGRMLLMRGRRLLDAA